MGTTCIRYPSPPLSLWQPPGDWITTLCTSRSTSPTQWPEGSLDVTSMEQMLLPSSLYHEVREFYLYLDYVGYILYTISFILTHD